MKIAPWIQIGAVLTAPTNWPDNDKVRLNPDGTVAGAYPMTWNDTVLSQSCSSIDFVDVHWYPQAPLSSGFGQETDNQLLNAAESGAADQSGNAGTRTKGIATMINDPTRGLRTLINKWCGAHASQVQIMVTETNSVYGDPGKQTVSAVNALFEDDDIMTWLENGAANVDWWTTHNSPQAFDNQKYVQNPTAAPVPNNFSPSLLGNPNFPNDFGDYGLLSAGGCVTIPPGPGIMNAGTCYQPNNPITEPPVDTPFPAYYGMQMLSHVIMTNDFGPATIVADSLSVGGMTDPAHVNLIGVHATEVIGATTPPGILKNLNVLFINKDPTNSYNETVSLDGETSSGTATVYTYGVGSTGISSYTFQVNGSSFTLPQAIPPYSLVAVDLPQTTFEDN